MTYNAWRTTIGIGLAVGVAVVSGVAVANWTSLESAFKAETPNKPPRSAPLPVGAGGTG